MWNKGKTNKQNEENYLSMLLKKKIIDQLDGLG